MKIVVYFKKNYKKQILNFYYILSEKNKIQ